MAQALGWSAALMIVSGYYGELTVSGDLTPRWICWFISMIFFLYVVYELLVGLAEATNKEDDPAVKQRIQSAQLITVISWSHTQSSICSQCLASQHSSLCLH